MISKHRAPLFLYYIFYWHCVAAAPIKMGVQTPAVITAPYFPSPTCLPSLPDSHGGWPTVFILCVHLGGGRNLAFVVGQTEVWELVLPVVVWSWASPLI